MYTYIGLYTMSLHLRISPFVGIVFDYVVIVLFKVLKNPAPFNVQSSLVSDQMWSLCFTSLFGTHFVTCRDHFPQPGVVYALWPEPSSL
jgi:hypothetical protein